MFIINIRLQNIGKTVENQPMTYDLGMYRIGKKNHNSYLFDKKKCKAFWWTVIS